MELRKNCRTLTTALSRFWYREAGPMNWKNPRPRGGLYRLGTFQRCCFGVAFLVGEWVRYGVRASQIVLAIPPTVILFCGGGVGSPFGALSGVLSPALETVPLLDLLEYHNPNFLQRRCGLVLPFSAGGS